MLRTHLVICMGLFFLGAAAQATVAEDVVLEDVPAAPAEAVKRWQSMRFGMFVHWGPVSLKGTEIGWSRQGPRRGRARGGTGTVPLEEYDHLYEQFNPVRFDAGQWIRVAQDAGMKYIVFTSKHHDGFSNFDTAMTDYKITNPKSPYGKDICAQLAEACHEQGMALGWYYSPRDWYHPDFATERHDQYLKFYMGQLRELCSNYGRVDILWFDGLDSPRPLWNDIPAESFRMLRSLQPQIVLNNRGGLPGDFDTPEQRVGGFNRDRPWETCMTICRQWAWKPDDQLKSLEECLQTLLFTVGGNGNLLFNVGPMPDGRIEPRQVERLQEMGVWIKEHAEGIYGTCGGPYKPGRWGAATCTGDTIYLYVMKFPEDGWLQLPPIELRVASIELFDGSEVSWQQDDRGAVRVNVAAAHREPIATVLKMSVAGDATTIEPVAVRHRSQSLAYGAKATASNTFHQMRQYDPGQAFDDDESTRWATDQGTHAAWLEVDLGALKTFDGVMIDEPDAFQRIKRFELKYLDENAAWMTFHRGEKIGPEWRLRCRPITTSRVRLEILEASDGPTLREFQLTAFKGQSTED